MISTFVRCASWIAVALVVFATAFWVLIVADGNYCWSAFAFTMSASSLGGCILLLGFIPSGILYLRKKQPGDLMSLRLTACSFITIVGEIILLWIIPQRGE